MSIVEKIFEYASVAPDKIALTDNKHTMTYSQLCGAILCAKEKLEQEYLIVQGNAVIIAADKQLSFVAAYFACHLIGATVLPLAPDINDKRLMFICNATNPKLAIGIRSDVVDCKKIDLLQIEGCIEDWDISDIKFPDSDIVADILFTTGTTGEPKGVVLSHANISAAANNINTFIGNTKDDVEMLALPISHSFGLGRLRCALSNGQTVVILGSFANMKRFFRYIDELGVTGFGMVPASWAMIRKLSGDKIAEYADKLRYIEIGSAAMPQQEKLRLIDMLPNTRICMHYGLTEASRSAFMEFHEDYEHLDTIGRQSPNMTIEIRDEDGGIVPNGAEGEICVKGDAVTKGYLNIPEVNIQSFWGDFFRTGDWGIKYDDGYIRLCSRKKELINVGGKKVSPIEVEEVVKELDFVNDCVCVAIDDPNGVLGEVVKCYIVTDRPDKIVPDSINAIVAGKLEDYKVPVAYEQIDEVPRTTSGKVQRLLLK